jgi:hypothetical protein
MTITTELIAQLRAAHAAATQGEWKICRNDEAISYVSTDTEPDMRANVRFITLAHNTLPALLDAMEEARAVIQEQRACIKELVEAVSGYLLDESPGFAGRIKRMEDAIARAQRALDGKAGE